MQVHTNYFWWLRTGGNFPFEEEDMIEVELDPLNVDWEKLNNLVEKWKQPTQCPLCFWNTNKCIYLPPVIKGKEIIERWFPCLHMLYNPELIIKKKGQKEFNSRVDARREVFEKAFKIISWGEWKKKLEKIKVNYK